MNTASLREEPKAAEVGDVGICHRCGHIMVYMKHGMIRNPNIEEAALFANNAEIVAIRNSILARP